jgi:hypothetical protein
MRTRTGAQLLVVDFLMGYELRAYGPRPPWFVSSRTTSLNIIPVREDTNRGGVKRKDQKKLLVIRKS